MALQINRIKDMNTEAEIKILLVDDREDNLLSMETVLQQNGYTFVKALSGKQALKILLNEYDFTLILMDVKMPVLSGFETATLIHSREKLKHIPVIFITAHDYSEENVFRGYETGAVDYIYKPINPSLLKAKVAVFADLYRKNHRLIMQEEILLSTNKNLEKEIQERKISEKRVLELNKKLEENIFQLKSSNSELEAFSYSVSHDLRAPIRGMDGFISLFLKKYFDKVDPEGQRLLNKVRNNVHKMGFLIDDLLSLSRIGMKDIEKSSINMKELVEGVIEEMEELKELKEAKIKLSHLIDGEGDVALIKQVWINLISNSLKYSSKNEKPLIEIGSVKKSNFINYYVKDNGVGFDMKYSNKLYGVFQRLHDPQEYQGTGVGLALVKRITNKHNGEVWAEGKENQGATFYFSLPVKSN
jgi:signal transduction histidine kinase